MRIVMVSSNRAWRIRIGKIVAEAFADRKLQIMSSCKIPACNPRADLAIVHYPVLESNPDVTTSTATQLGSDVPVVVVDVPDDPLIVTWLLTMGIAGYTRETSSSDEFNRVIQMSSDGMTILDRQFVAWLSEHS